MTTTPPEAPPEGPRVSRDEVRDLGRLRRTTHDRRVAGVAGGLARHLDVDPVVLRVAFVVLVLFGGAGLVLYAACWLLVPADDRTAAPLALDERTRGVALLLVGAFAVLLLLGDAWGDRPGLGWQLAVVAVVVLLLVGRRQPEPPGQVDPADPTDPGTNAGATYQPVPRPPRRRGPVLFWFTLALVALAEGLLGIADLAGAPVADAAYPALAVATIGAMLVVGAFYGRAGGLVLVGLVAVLALGVTTAASDYEGESLRRTPTSAAEVRDAYRISSGEIILDLRTVRDLDALDGRTLRLSGDLGQLVLLVPPGLDVDVSARVEGPGRIALFGAEQGGVDLAGTRSLDGGPGAPALSVDARLGVGQVEVHQ